MWTCRELFVQVRGLARTVQVVEIGPVLALVVVSVVVNSASTGCDKPW